MRCRHKIPAKKLEALYISWVISQSQIDYDAMLNACIDSIYAQNIGFGHDDADVIASNAATRIARALPGSHGLKPLKAFDRKKGTFASFVSRVGKSAMRDFLKQQTPLHAGDKRLVFCADNGKSTAEESLDYFNWASTDPWHSDGKKHTQKTPIYDCEDPDSYL
jgi:hypothetical protein